MTGTKLKRKTISFLSENVRGLKSDVDLEVCWLYASKKRGAREWNSLSVPARGWCYFLEEQLSRAVVGRKEWALCFHQTVWLLGREQDRWSTTLLGAG
jgi:hypothetical protein